MSVQRWRVDQNGAATHSSDGHWVAHTDHQSYLAEREQRIAELEAALTKINALRNDIVGRQAIGFSRHVYPLVTILNEAGFAGMSYEEARAALATEGEKRE